MQGSIDFTGLLSGDIIGEGGTTVIANPSGSATDTLNKVQIDETIYSVEGGSEVIANPTGSATDTLNKIQVDNTIYAIEGSEQIQSDWTQTDTNAVDYIKHKPSLSAVATTGSYNDLTNKPSLSTVATSGSYDDLYNKPTIPTIEANPVGSATDTLTKINIDGSIYDIPSGGGSSITLTKLTKAQYDSLTPLQQTDPSIIYFIDDPVPVLDPNYTYYKAVNDQIVVRIYHENESDEHIVWFFNGFEKTSGDVSVPATLLNYVPTLDTSVTSHAMSPTSSEATYDYWIGWSRTLGNSVIRSWNSSWTSTTSGTFWAVVDNEGGDEQENEYTTPYVYITGHSDNYIYYQGIRYDDTTADNVSYDNANSGLTATNVQSAVDELKSNLTQLDGLNVVKRITTPASVVSFSDGSNLPMYKLEIEIDNVSGCTEANVSVSGVNIYNGQWEVGGIRVADGTTVSASAVRSKEYIQVPIGEKLYFFIPATIYIYYYDLAKNYKGYISIANSAVVTPPQGTKYVKYQLTSTYGTTYNNDISINYPSTDTEYHTYNGQTYNVEFKDGSNPLTVYNGTLDIITGLLTVNDTTPPTYYNLSPISATTLTGVNNIYCDTGNILEVDYTTVINFS